VGDLPTIFTGKSEDAEQFINEMEGYFLLNQNIPKYYLPIQKVALALTLIKRAEVTRWARDIRTWVAGLNPATQNIPKVWEQFMAKFLDQFADTQATICTQTKLDELRMVYPHINKYIADFEKTARQAGYTQGNEETKHHFIQGMANEILEDVLWAPWPNTYAGLKERAIESTHTRILLRDILKRNCMPTTFRSSFKQFQ
jgi:Retrotransposon gag protein